MAGIVFLDRDGVINADSPEFIKSVKEWVPIPGSLDAIARLSQAQYRVVVVTNQSGIARGLYDDGVLREIHDHMRQAVAAVGGELAGIYACPHAPAAGCECRKPRTGLIDRARSELGLSARGAPMIGDRWTDVLAARAAGCRPILVRSGFALPEEVEAGHAGDVEIFADLAKATDALLAGTHDRRP